MWIIGEINDELFQCSHLFNNCRFTAYVPLPSEVMQYVQRLLTYPRSVAELIGSNSVYLVIAVLLDELLEEARGIWLQVLQAEKNS